MMEAPMLTRTKAAYRARIANANERDVAYYRRVMAGYNEYPFEQEGSTELARAVWLDMHGYLENKPMNEIKQYMKRRGWNAKTMATATGLKLNTFYKVLSSRIEGPSVQKVMDYIAANPIERKAVEPVDLHEWRQAVRKLDGMIAAGRVRDIEIHLVEVGA
jgi:hypothetical protein